MKFQAYFDDSGSHVSSPIALWGGFVGTPKQWETLNSQWRAKLAEPMAGKEPLTKFSLGDCKHQKGEFKLYDSFQTDIIRKEFRQIIQDVGVVGVACGVDTTSYRTEVLGWANHFFGKSPTAFTLGGVLEYTMQYVMSNYPNFEHVAFSFDQGQETEHIKELFDRGGKLFGRKYPDITSDTYDLVRHCPGLQAADTLATEFFWHLKKNRTESLGAAEPYFAEFVKGTNTTLVYVDEVELVRMLKEADMYSGRK